MKKIFLLAVAATTIFSAGAQMNVVKDAERAMKANDAANKVVEIITPAFSNPETQGLAQTYYIPGKASFNQYDKFLGLKQFGQLKEADANQMGSLLLQGFEFFEKALPLDTVVDPKGKIKTKYSKDIVGTISGHISDITTAGVEAYNRQNYEEAYKLWGAFCKIPEMPGVVAALGKSMPTDTLFGEIAFNQALAAWQYENLKGALDAFDNARKHSYDKKQLYDYAISVATGLQDTLKILEYAQEGYKLYGKEEPMYTAQIINYYLQTKKYDDAYTFINEAIAAEPNNAQYYVIRGVLNENTDKKEDAYNDYLKATQLNPENAEAFYNLGRAICDQAYALNDNAPTSTQEYNVYYMDKIKPLFEQAADVLEKAYTLNPDNVDVLRYLENVYYNLNDEAKMADVKKRMSY